MTKLDGNYETIEDVKELFEYAATGIMEEVVEKESSLTVTKDELKEVYLDAAKRVGEINQKLGEMKLNDLDAYGINSLREYLKIMRKCYIHHANGKIKAAEKQAPLLLKVAKKYEEQRKYLYQTRFGKKLEDETMGEDLK